VVELAVNKRKRGIPMSLLAVMVMVVALLGVIGIPVALFFYLAYKAEKSHLELHIDAAMSDIDEAYEELIREEGSG
jgi:hypothetical protein